jgi:hypothetical protein
MGFSAPRAGAAPASAAGPNYDEQIGITFTQDLTGLAYNVTALAQVDANGYGPAYLLNGVTPSGYWYQAGISYHWPSSSGTYDPTFGFSYEVYGPGAKPVFPTNGGAGLGSFSKAVHSGDSVLLSLTFSGSSVQMLAQDWNTGATAKTSYSSMGSSTFLGDQSRPSNSQGFFSGLMTEWYHDAPYTANVGKVTYSNQAVALSSAWMWIDEFETGSSPIFLDQTQAPVAFTNEQQIYPFASHGVTMYGSAHQFITGLLNTTFSRVSLTPAAAESASPPFAATYTLAGLKQTSEMAAGNGTLVEADPKTSVTILVNSSGSSALESWVFGGTGESAITSVTFAAGSNVTYVYYHLLQQTVSYELVGGGSLPRSPELVYFVPPAAASGISSPVKATQLLGTDPVVIFAILGSSASLAGPVPGAANEQWAAGSGQVWSVSASNAIPNPIQFYHQYQISAEYSVAGGGTPPNAPEIVSNYLGSPTTAPMSVGQTTYWFDAGSSYSCTRVINGSSSPERWLGAGSGIAGIVTTPAESIAVSYIHQYQAFLAGNDASGGSISFQTGLGGTSTSVSGPSSGLPFQGPVWFDAGSTARVSASANQGWQFESWNGSGAGAYSGTNPSIDVELSGAINETAIFYLQLSISADANTNLAYSYASAAGTVQAGSTKVLYLPPSTNVTLRASPSLFVYYFASWKGAGLANATRPSLSFVVDAPSAVSGTSSYNYPVLLGIAATAALIILAGSLWIRSRRKRASFGALTPGTALA